MWCCTSRASSSPTSSPTTCRRKASAWRPRSRRCGPTSHVAIVARALGIAAVGEVANATGVVDPGDAIIVDGSTGDVHIRPSPDLESAYVERVRLRARRQLQYMALRDKPCVTKDGE